MRKTGPGPDPRRDMVAANIMATCAVRLGEEESASEAVRLFKAGGTRLIPVVGKDGMAAGVVTYKGILEAAVFSGASSCLKGAIEAIGALCLKEVLARIGGDFISVSPETPSHKIAGLFADRDKNTECVLVVDDGGRLLGVITAEDLLRRLWENTAE